MSVSSIGVLSPFQQDVNFPGQLVTSAPRIELSFEGKLQSGLVKPQPDLHHSEDSSGVLFLDHTSTNVGHSSGEDAKRHSGDTTKKSCVELPQLNLLSTCSESSSHFVSAAGGLEWLIQTLKDKCLTERCTVQLERLNILPLSQLWSQTTYQSCLEDEHSVNSQQITERPMSLSSGQTVDPPKYPEKSFDICLSGSSNKDSVYLLPGDSFLSPKMATSVTDSQSSPDHRSLLVDCKHSVLYDESTHNTNCSTELIMSTQLPNNSSLQNITHEEVEKFALPLSNTKHLQEFTKQTDCLTWDESFNLNTKKSENDQAPSTNSPVDLVSVRLSVNNISALTQAQSNNFDTAMLEEKCTFKRLCVNVKRLTLSELKDILMFKDSPTVVSDPASEELTRCPSQSDSDSNENTFSMKTKRRSTSSDDQISSDKEVAKKSCDVLPKRKKMSLARKETNRRSTSADRPGTARKACVSGLSVSRWRNKGSNTHLFKSRADSIKAVDCSISELVSSQRPQPRVRAAHTNTTKQQCPVFEWLCY